MSNYSRADKIVENYNKGKGEGSDKSEKSFLAFRGFGSRTSILLFVLKKNT